LPKNPLFQSEVIFKIFCALDFLDIEIIQKRKFLETDPKKETANLFKINEPS
jgi:hypothetical protein